MKKIVIVILLIFGHLYANSQTALTQGDLVFVGFNSLQNPPTQAKNFISFIARKNIAPGTVIFLTNNEYTGNNISPFLSAADKQGMIRIIFDEPLSIGQIVEIQYSTTSNSGNNALKINVGKARYSDGSNFEFDKTTGNSAEIDNVYIFQSTDTLFSSMKNSDLTFITGITWGNTAPNPKPNSLNYSTTSSGNSLLLNVKGSSTKCAVWVPNTNAINATTGIPFSANITTTFYDNDNWIESNSNSISNGWCACNPDSVNANVAGLTNLYTKTVELTSFDQYLYSSNGSWYEKISPSSTWTKLGSGISPDWGANTQSREVIVHKSLVLSNPSSRNFECGALTVEDTVGQDGVTLTVEPGHSLNINLKLNFDNPNGGTKPAIHLKSNHISQATQFAQLGMSYAEFSDIDGEFVYDLWIQNPGWHHLISPISSTFNNINFFPQPSDSVGTPPARTTFTFISGNPGVGNFFSWNSTISQWENGNITDDFSNEPYTIFFKSIQVPTIMRIRGPLAITNQNTSSNQIANYHDPTPNTSSIASYGNVPFFEAGDDGWNFYGNPFLSHISTDSLLLLYSSIGTNSQNKMNGLNNYLYAWQPAQLNTVSNNTWNLNGSTYYKARTISGTTATGSTQATYLPPFQAFFMRSNPNSNSNTGFALSKKYRKVHVDATKSITNKTTTKNHKELRIVLLNNSNSLASEVILAESNKKFKANDFSSDVLMSSSTSTKFALVNDSSQFYIKFWPLHDTTSIDLFFSHPGFNNSFQIIDLSESSFLLDRKLNIIHNLKTSPYTFYSDPSWNDQLRFKLIINDNINQLDNVENDETSELKIVYHPNTVVIYSDSSKNFDLYNMEGKLITRGQFEHGFHSLEKTNYPNGLYIFTTDNGLSSKILIQ